ncbi:MAG: hypothetical protein WC788_00990 [Candidatus Paceibacterota bacterium]|jgi:hypothetical protein
MSKTTTLLLALAIIVSLSGCTEYYSKSSYFNGTVAVEYRQTKTGNSDDYLTFRFYDPGTYEISFSIPSGKAKARTGLLPEDFKQEIETAPREITIKQHVLPDHIRITIKKDGQTESHDFS